MKQILFLLTFVLFSSSLYAVKWDNKEKSLKGKKILIFTKNGKGFVHKNIAASVDMFLNLGQKYACDVDTTSNSALFTDTNLKKYNIVVFSNTNNDVFDTEQERNAFQRFVQNGGGVVGIHSACGTERNWAWFKQMIGGTFTFHPPFQPFTVEVVDPLHPSAKKQPTSRITKDELYFVTEMNPSLRIIMMGDFSAPGFINNKPAPTVFGNRFPIVWCNEFDGGRQWVTSLGHDDSDYKNEHYINHVVGGLRWVLK